MGGVLALDIARQLGWAVATADACRRWPRTQLEARGHDWTGVRSGSVTLAQPAASHGRLYAAFADWLADAITVHAPNVVVIEAPLPRINGGAEAARRSLGLSAVADLVCYRREVECFEAANNSVKKTFAGAGRAEKGDMLRACQARGWDPKDDNEADALALLDHSILLLRERRNWRPEHISQPLGRVVEGLARKVGA